LNRFYADGKDMGALLDELACLTRDFMVIKTAPKEGISMLSGVASEGEVQALSERFSSGELVRMMGIIQQTAAGFTRSTSRRMDTELCIVNLCQPELVLNIEALNARLTRLEDQLHSGNFTVKTDSALAAVESDLDCPPIPDDEDAPPEPEQEISEPVQNQIPVGFWTDLAAEIRRELKPPVSGFFAPTSNAPIQCVLQDDKLVLVCANTFTMEIINKPEILSLVSRKASAKLGRNIQASAADRSARNMNSAQMERLLQFGRDHSDIIKIK
jgi:DNA polymerase-3 subunit gamma/tau